MIEKEIITIEGKEYFILMELIYQDTNYAYLANKKNVEDFLILKSVYEKEEEYLTSLDSEEEFAIVFSLFQKKAKEKE